MINLIITILIRGFLGWLAGGVLGGLIVAPIIFGMAGPQVTASSRMATIFWCYLIGSTLGIVAGVVWAVRGWLKKRRPAAA